MGSNKFSIPMAVAVLAALGAGLAAPRQSHAATIFSDGFTDGAVTNGADAQDADWSTTSAGLTLAVANDPALGTDALKFSPTGGFTSTIASFPQAVTLANTGDYVDVSFRFRMDTALKTTGSIRFGLYDAMGTPAVDDGGLAPAGSASDDLGYYAVLSAQAAGGHGLREESGGTDRIMAGTDFALLAGNASLPGVTDTAVHTAALRITKLAAGVNVAWSYDGVTYIDRDDATPQTLTYDEFAYQSSEANKASFLDDAVVTTNVASPVAAVPLPASSAGGVILLTGLAAAQGLRRRLATGRA